MTKKQYENNKHKKTTEDVLYCIGLLLFLCVSGYWAACAFFPKLSRITVFPPCPFYRLTGYYCPGCGGTRAVRALFRGHLAASFFYHPLVPYAAAVYLYFMGSQSIERLSHKKLPIGMRYRNGYAWAALIILILHFLVRNFSHSIT